jgi:F-type H+-transporting ATPase subunit b
MRLVLLVGIVVLALAASSPGHARAGEGPAAASSLLAAADKGGGGEEKIDLFKGWVDLSLWSIVVFLVLFFLLSRYAWPQIAEGLDRREKSIARDKEDAEKARREADEMRKKLQAEMARVNEEIRVMMDKARHDAEKTAAEEVARGKAELQAERDRLHRELAVSRDQALHQMWTQAANLATLISGKAIRKQLGPDDHRALLDEALTEFRSAAQTRRHDLESAHA